MSCFAWRRSASETRRRTYPSPRFSSTRRLPSPDIDAINEMSSFASLMLFSDIDSAALANHDDAHLTGILHLFLDLMGDIVSQDRGLGIGNLVRLDHDVDLATGLHGIGTFDAVMRVGDLLELLKTLDVVLGRLATGTGARGRDSIGGLYQDIEHRIGVDIGMVSSIAWTITGFSP